MPRERSECEEKPKSRERAINKKRKRIRKANK